VIPVKAKKVEYEEIAAKNGRLPTIIPNTIKIIDRKTILMDNSMIL
jgi:hypothetical protein